MKPVTGRMKRLLAAVLLAALTLTSVNVNPMSVVRAAEAPTMTLSGDKTELHRGDTLTMTLEYSKGENVVNGVQATISYSTDVLQLTDCEEGTVTSKDVNNKNVQGDINSDTAGTIGVSLASTNGLVDGNIFTATFTVKSDAAVDASAGITVSAVKIVKGSGGDSVVLATSATNTLSSLKVVVPTTALSITETTATLTKGSDKTLTLVRTPSDSTAEVTWSSSNTSVATVDSSGKVTAVGAGTANITASTGSITSNACAVTVTAPITAITLSSDKTTIKPGQTTTINVAYTPDDTTDAKSIATWTSSDTSKATVSNGVVTAVAEGTVTITATTAGGVSGTIDITVNEVHVDSIALNKTSTTINKGETETLSVTFTPAKETITDDISTIAWTTSDGSIATVADGVVTAVGKGTATITATVAGKSATCTVEVKNPLKSITATQSGTAVTSISLKKGQTATIDASYDTTTDSTVSISYTSSDPAVASVTTSGTTGTITAAAEGTTTITLDSGVSGVTATVSVTVTEVHIGEVVIDKTSATVEAGDTVDLTATVAPADSTDEKTVTWSTSDAGVASLSATSTTSGGTVTVTAAGGGTATITATSSNGKSATFTLKVLRHITGISLNGTFSDTIIISSATTDNSEAYNVTITPTEHDDAYVLVWSSDATDVATVDATSGAITGKKAGTATITATMTINASGGVPLATPKTLTATKSVTVKENSMTDAIGNNIAFDDSKIGSSNFYTGASNSLYTFLNLQKLLDDNKISDSVVITYESDDEEIATVDASGNLVGKKEGTVNITATIKTYNAAGTLTGTYTATGSFDIKTAPAAPAKTNNTTELTSITLSSGAVDLLVGNTATLSVNYVPEGATADGSVTWSSSDPAIATVDASGVVTGKAAGTATITATIGGFSASCTVTVRNNPDAASAQSTGYVATNGNNEKQTYGNNGVFAASDEGYLPSHGALIVTDLSSGNEYNNAISVLGRLLRNRQYDVKDISLYDSNWVAIHQLDGEVWVAVPAPFTPANGMTINVYRVEGNSYVQCVSEYRGDSVVFRTDHFSTYVFVEGAETDMSSLKSPKTNGDSYPYGLVVTMLAAAGGLALMRRKRNAR